MLDFSLSSFDEIACELGARLKALRLAQGLQQTELATRAARDNFDRLMMYVNRMPTEFQVVFTRDAARRDVSVQKTTSFTKWCIANHDVLT